MAALVAAGHEVRSVASSDPGADDLAVLALARREQRCLVTFDSDFGDLVFRQRAQPPLAIVFLRMHPIVPAEVAALTLRALQLPVDGCLIVATPDGLRRRPFTPA